MPTEVLVDDSTIRVRFQDGSESATSIQRFPRLLHATPQQRNVWQVIGKGDGIHWPEVDEDISMRTLRGERPPMTSSSATVEEVLRLTGDIYQKSDRLRTISGIRSFTPDGHFVAAVGKVVAQYIYDLSLANEKDRFADAKTGSGRSVQIMLAGPTGTRFGIRWSDQVKTSHAEILLCLKLTGDGFEEIYNGLYPVELVEGKPAGQVQVSLRRLLDLNPALLDKAHSFASINRFLPPDLANVA